MTRYFITCNGERTAIHSRRLRDLRGAKTAPLERLRRLVPWKDWKLETGLSWCLGVLVAMSLLFGCEREPSRLDDTAQVLRPKALCRPSWTRTPRVSRGEKVICMPVTTGVVAVAGHLRYPNESARVRPAHGPGEPCKALMPSLLAPARRPRTRALTRADDSDRPYSRCQQKGSARVQCGGQGEAGYEVLTLVQGSCQTLKNNASQSVSNPATRADTMSGTERLFRAVCWVESREGINTYNRAEEAAGPAQITPICVADCNRIARASQRSNASQSSIGYERWTLADRYDRAKSFEMFVTYTGHYLAHYNLSGAESAARIWNGGPRGWEKKATEKYWRKVRTALTTYYSAKRRFAAKHEKYTKG